MSHIAFTDGTETVSVAGREVHQGYRYARGLAAAAVYPPERGDLFKCPIVSKTNPSLANEPHFARLHTDNAYGNALTWELAGRTKFGIFWNGQIHDGRLVVYDTALAFASDPMKLLIRLSVACEVHTWADGPHRAWLAGIVEEGLRSKVLRRDPMGYDGWEKLALFLRNSDARPIFTSYSVTDGFPSREAAGWQEEPDAWHDVPQPKQWELCEQRMREQEKQFPFGTGLELRPDTQYKRYWSDFRFNPAGPTFLHLYEAAGV